MWVVFVKGLKYRWVEYMLAIVMVAVVVALITAQRALSAHQEQQIHDLAHRLGKNMLVIPAETDLAAFYRFEYGRAEMPASYAERIQHSELSQHIKVIQSRLYGNITIGDLPVLIVGESTMAQSAAYQAVSPVPAGKVLVGPTAASRLGVKASDTLRLRSRELEVDGILADPPEGLDLGLVTSLDVAQDVLSRPGVINAMRLGGCWCRIDVPGLGSQIEQLLPGVKALTMQGMLRAQQGTIASAKRYTFMIHAVAIVLIAGIIMLLTWSQVRRAKREIGLLLAIGTTPAMITAFYAAAAGLVGVLGSFSGYALGTFLTTTAVSRLMGVSLVAAEGTLPVALGLSVTGSILAALYPALRAGRLDVTEILREV